MIDKVVALHRDRIKKRAGALDPGEMAQEDSALRLWFGIE
jgi:hypothetical protein